MRLFPLAFIGTAILVLAGCHSERSSPDRMARHGRYSGIGLFSPSALWSKLALDDASTDRAAATTADDDMIVVVMDSNTGEVRECGNYSGRCVSLNPWSKAIARKQQAPVALTGHAAGLAEAGATSAIEPLSQQQPRRQARQQ